MSVSSGPPKFRVAVCGAGIAGLILAITIGKYDPSVPIDLYEAHDAIDTAGVGISLWERTNEIMTELGLFDEFKQIFTRDPEKSAAPRVRRADIRDGGYDWYRRVQGQRPSMMHRQHMVAILERYLPPSCTVHARKRLVDYTEPERRDGCATTPIILNFADGTTAIADVLVGADGIRSTVRKALFEAASEKNGDDEGDLEQYAAATFTGMTVYRFLVDAETLRKENPESMCLQEMVAFHGKARTAVTYPIAKGTLINVVAIMVDPSLANTRYEGHWVSDGNRDDLIQSFDNFEPDLRAVLKLCEKPSKWALHVVKPLPFCVRQRVALIGDACHAMTPHFAAGAGQGIEDAFVLGRLIAHPLATLDRVRDAFRIYEEIRLPVCRSIARMSLSTGWMYAFLEPGYYDGTRGEDDLDERGVGAYEREGMEAMRQEVFRRWDIMEESSGGLQAWKDAESRLRALAG